MTAYLVSLDLGPTAFMLIFGFIVLHHRHLYRCQPGDPVC